MIMIVKTPGSQMGSPAAHNCWVHRDILTADVPELVKAFDTRPSTFKARASAPKRATKGYNGGVCEDLETSSVGGMIGFEIVV